MAPDHFVLTVAHVDQSAAFYRDVLGLAQEDSGQKTRGAVSLRCGDILLRLRPKTNATGAVVASQLSTGCFDFCLRSQLSSDQVLSRLTAAGVPIVAGPVRRHGSQGEMTSIYVHDPDGNLVEICSYQK
jgi:catechol 2,3-dioxygenase-like lactoylglutathione lyase family enzyme